jgi:hypothetical protein
MPPPSSRLYPETVPGGSLIGSVNSHFAAAAISPDASVYYNPTLLNSDLHSESPQKPKGEVVATPTIESPDVYVSSIIQGLPRAEMEALVTRAWLYTVHNQSEDNLRNLLFGAVKHKILSEDDIHGTCTNAISRLPTKVFRCLHVDNRSNSESCRF